MVNIASDDVRKYLDLIRRFKQGCSFYDLHVHPFEVLFSDNRPAYQGPANLPLPEVGAIVEDQEDDFRGEAACRFKRAAQVLTLKRNYQNAGPERFVSHMEVAAVDHSLLLPIAPATGEMDPPMEWVEKVFAGGDRFLLGCSVPNTIHVSRVHEFLSRMKSAFQVRAVKLHPNITEVDLAAAWGKERAEAILDSCGENALPLVIHGGRSNVLRNAGAHAYGSIANMGDIAWSRSGNAVVIAHGGAYECSPLEVAQDVLPILDRLLSHHPNLFIDLSGLDCEVQIQLLKRIGPERIVFGSDALYGAPWREAAKLIYSLEKAGCRVEESYLMIAGETPERHFFKRKDDRVRGFAHTAASGH